MDINNGSVQFLSKNEHMGEMCPDYVARVSRFECSVERQVEMQVKKTG